MEKTQDPIELMEAWHANECLGMLDRLMRGIPPEGGHVSKDTMEQLLATAFLTGAICQQDRPLKKSNNLLVAEIDGLRKKLSYKTQTCTIAEGTIREQRHRIESLEADNLIYSTQRKRDQATTARFAEAMTLLRREENAESMVARLREILFHNAIAMASADEKTPPKESTL